MEKKGVIHTLAELCIVASMERGLSEEQWNSFIATSKVSNVPLEFSGVFYHAPLSRLRNIFGDGSFCTAEEGIYAITYAAAMAAIKAWVSYDEYLSKIRDDAAFIVDTPLVIKKTTPKKITEIRELITDIKKEMEQAEIATQSFQERAKFLCAAVIQLESYGQPPAIKNFKNYFLWVVKWMFGKKATAQDLKRTRDWVETFFNEKQNISNVILRARRKSFS